jgi:hypothetical protein
LEEKGAFPEEIKAERIAGANLLSGEVENIPLLAGLSAASIFEIKSCQEIIEEIISTMSGENDKFVISHKP